MSAAIIRVKRSDPDGLLTLTGWKLDRIADYLRDGELLAVRSLPSRYGNTVDPTVLFVSNITVEPIKKE